MIVAMRTHKQTINLSNLRQNLCLNNNSVYTIDKVFYNAKTTSKVVLMHFMSKLTVSQSMIN